jgi:UDP-glucose 4-epimerase
MISPESPLKHARVIVLGASGFIGQHVTRALHLRGADLVLTCREPMDALPLLLATGDLGDIVGMDLGDLDAVANLIAEECPDCVFNLAGYGVDRAERDPGQATLLNTELVEAVCVALARVTRPAMAGLRALVHVGSAFEYGPVGGDLDEAGPADPTTEYGRTKLAGTTLVGRYGELGYVDGVTARLFTVYGPGEHPHRLLPSLMAAAREGRPVELTAGQQQRDFTYVEDVAEGLCRLACSRGDRGEVINLATGRLTSVREFVRIAAAELGLTAEQLRFGAVSTGVDETAHDPVTLARLTLLTGWTPSMSIAEGVRRAAESATVDL